MVVADGDIKTHERLLNYSNLAGHLTKISVTFSVTRVPTCYRVYRSLEVWLLSITFFADGVKAVHLNCFVCFLKEQFF